MTDVPPPVPPQQPPVPPQGPVDPPEEPPGPPPQTPPPDFRGYPPPPAPHSGGSVWTGVAISGAVGLLAWIIGALSMGSYDGIVVFLFLVFVLPILMLIVGIVLAAIPRTRRTGGGLLLGLGAAVLITGGVCVALITGSSM